MGRYQFNFAAKGLSGRSFRAHATGTSSERWFGFQSTADLRRRFAENGLLGPDGGLLSVAEGDVTVGRVKWFPGSWGPADLANWSLAIGLVPSARSRGIGTRAQQLLAEYLFDHTRADRIQAWTDCANLAEQRALEKAGFVKEGVLRSVSAYDLRSRAAYDLTYRTRLG
ncbi:GNAT family protein [Streptomyces sp. NPDC048479]|uniref:GNAT family N-acetyltransferase n=1 Tax=Streptomyces sp. NPDC048479 TaxID=3154725 RepID=UPI00344154FB